MSIRRWMLSVVLFVFGLAFSHAQTGSHWQCNIYDYQYDMTVYFSLSVDGTEMTDMSGYEVAAFCGTECRGVGEVQSATVGGTARQYGYLRVRSNAASGETISFKVYDKTAGKELPVAVTQPFVSQQAVGLPSTPLVLSVSTSSMKGDVNRDGVVDVADVVATVNYILQRSAADFDIVAAEVTGDGEIDVADVVGIVNIILNKQ